jgi:hypothetical protein
MKRRLAVVAAALAVAAVQAGAQDYRAPRTSWGDPDLEGTWSNDNEYATPLERPAEFADRRLADVTATQLAEIRREATARMIAQLAPGPRGPDSWWLENLDLTKRSQPWLIIDPPDGKIPALTPEARERAGQRVRSSFVGGPFNSPADFNPLERCISRGVPGSMIPVMYGNVYTIFQAPGYIVITYEIIHEARVIPLDGRAHVSPAVTEHMGDPRGHWEADTLVVETTNFKALTAYRRANPDRLKIVERFKRVAPDKVAWSATMDDPTTWTAPWTIAMPLTLDPQPVLPFECNEGNYGLRNILSGARTKDAQSTQ